MIRTLIVDDHAVFRQELAFLVEREPDMTVVAQAGSLIEARTVLATAGLVHVAILDLGLPDGDGVELVRRLRTPGKLSPTTRVLVLTGADDRGQTARAVEAGAGGVLHMSAPAASPAARPAPSRSSTTTGCWSNGRTVGELHVRVLHSQCQRIWWKRIVAKREYRWRDKVVIGVR